MNKTKLEQKIRAEIKEENYKKSEKKFFKYITIISFSIIIMGGVMMLMAIILVDEQLRDHAMMIVGAMFMCMGLIYFMSSVLFIGMCSILKELKELNK